MWGRVRPCRPRDIGEIMRMVREIAALHKVPPEEVETDERVLLEAGFGATPPLFECFVAELPPGEEAKDGRRLVGYVLSVDTFSARGGLGLYMDNLYVRPPWRGRRLGRRLVEAAAQAAWARGCRELRMHVGGAGGAPLGVLGALGGVELPGGGADTPGRGGWRLLRFEGGVTRRLAGGGGAEPRNPPNK